MRFCDKTDSTVELFALNAKAQSEKKSCVGVTGKGDLFTVTGKEHHKISVEAAAEILETTVAEVQKFVDARGDYQIKDPEPVPLAANPIPEPEPTPVPEVQTPEEEVSTDPNPAPKDPTDPISAAAEIVAKAVGEVLAEHEVRRDEQIDRIEAKIDKLKEAVDKLQEAVENFYL